MWKQYICVCLLSVVVYLNTLRAGFVYDDNRAIITNQDIKTTTPLSNIFNNDFWGTPLSSSNSHGSYRPLCVLTFRLNYWVWGLSPLGYHLVNILLHSIATGLVLHVGSLLLPGKCPVTAAAMFAVHPIHTEAVAGIVGRADVLACVFYLLSFIMYYRHVQIRTTAYQNKIKIFTNETKLSPEAKVECLVTIYSYYKFFNVCKIRRYCENSYQHFRRKKTNTFLHVYLILSVCFSICSTLCKETGITVLGVCTVYEVLLRARSNKKISSAAVGLFTIASTTLVLLFLRLHLTGFKPPAFSSADNPTSHDISLLTRTLSFLYLPLINFRLLVYPKLLSFDWSMDAIPRIYTLFDVRNILTLSFYVVLYQMIKGSYCKILKKRRDKFTMNKQKIKCFQCNQNLNTFHTTTCRLKNNNNTPITCSCPNIAEKQFDINQCILMCITFMVLPFLPATNLPFYVGFVVAERVLYLPSVGYCFLFALGLNCFCHKVNKRLSFAILCFLLTTHAVRTVQRNEDWGDEESLYRSGIPVNPPKAYGNLGSILSSQGRLKEAEEAFRLALLHRPNMADVHYNLGNLQAGLKRYSDAIHSYEMAIRFRPSLAVSYLNLAHLLATIGRYTEAEKVLLKCSKLESVGLKDINTHKRAQVSALLHLSRLYFEKGNVQEAVDVFRDAVNMKTDHEMLNMKDKFLMDSPSHLGLNEETRKWFTAILNPDPIHAYLIYGKLLMKNITRSQEVDYWFQRAPLLILKDPMVYMHYGKYLVDSGRYKEAVQIYLEASQLRIDQYNVVSSAAAIFRHRERYNEAEVFYRKAVYIRPKDSTSHSNLGAILHLKGNYKEEEASYKEAESSYQEAESCYREALKYNSRDETALVNLRKLRNWIKRNTI